MSVLNENSLPSHEQMRQAMAEDPHISDQEMTEIRCLSRGAVHRIVHKELGLKTVCAKWVNRLLPDTGMQN